MRNYLIYALHFLIVLLGTSCDNFTVCEQFESNSIAQNTTSPTYMVEPAPDSIAVNKYEIRRVLASLNKTINVPQSRSSEDYTISTIYNSDGTPGIYVINYVNNNGFVLVSATKNGYPVLAFNTIGNFNFEELADSYIGAWASNICEHNSTVSTYNPDSASVCRNLWKKYEQPVITKTASRTLEYDELHELENIMMDSISRWNYNNKRVYRYEDLQYTSPEKAEFMKNILQGGAMYPMYWDDFDKLSVYVELESSREIVSDCGMAEIWMQDNGFNQSYPIAPTGKPYYAGCGPVAAGQIMHFYRHPSNINWSDMPMTTATKTTSDFLKSIALKSNPTYYDNGEIGVTMSNLTETIKSFGYNADYKSKYNEKDLSYPCIISSTYYDRISSGNNTPSPHRHAWIISGVKSFEFKKITQIWSFKIPKVFNIVYTESSPATFGPAYYYINWGWGSLKNNTTQSGNGWYTGIETIVPHNSYTNGSLNSMIVNIYPK